MSHGNTMPPGEALAFAVAALGTVDGCDSVHSHMNTDDGGAFVSTTLIWQDVDGSVLAEATVLASGEALAGAAQ